MNIDIMLLERYLSNLNKDKGLPVTLISENVFKFTAVEVFSHQCHDSMALMLQHNSHF